jgi:xanthine dehydrogenase molybdopterin-binding subunit B
LPAFQVNSMQEHTKSSTLENAIALQKYGVGQPVRRKEDDTLVRGKGRYTDDFNLPGQAHAVIVRSTHAHGVIRGRACSGCGPAKTSMRPATAPSPAACR